MLVDSHCHLDFDAFDGELDSIVANAKDAGVGMMVTICTKLSAFDRVLAIAERYDNIYCSVGVHPHEAGAEGVRTADQLVELAAHPRVVGIGETGLDYFYDHSPRGDQQASFAAHIAAAQRTGLPLIVHSRDADEDMARMLQEAAARAPFDGVLHCFSSGRTLAEMAVGLGLYVSFSGILTFKNAVELREIAADLPLSQVLVETDSPYLAPVPKRGKRNEPSYVAHTAAKLAELRGVGSAEIAATTTDNFFKLFAKTDRRLACV